MTFVTLGVDPAGSARASGARFELARLRGGAFPPGAHRGFVAGPLPDRIDDVSVVRTERLADCAQERPDLRGVFPCAAATARKGAGQRSGQQAAVELDAGIRVRVRVSIHVRVCIGVGVHSGTGFDGTRAATLKEKADA